MTEPAPLPPPLPYGPGVHHLIPRPADGRSDGYPHTPRVAPSSGHRPGGDRPTLDRPLPSTEPGSAAASHAWERIDAFNRESQGLPEDVLVARIERARALFGPVDDRLVGVFAAADLRAELLQAAVRRGVDRTHWCLALAFLFFGLTDLTDWAIIGFVLLLLVAAWPVWTGRSRRVEAEYLDCRALAEGIRVLAYWRRAGLSQKVTERYLTQHLAVVDWIRTALAELERLAPPLAADPAAFEEIRTRWIDGQQRYFASKLPPAHGKFRWWSAAPRLAMATTLALAIIYSVVVILGRGPETGAVFQAVLAWVGGAAVVAEGYADKRGFEQLLVQYHLAHDLFERAARQLDGGADPAAIVLRLGEEALRENGEWLTYFRGHPLTIRL